jgi:hypothetical protein
MTSTDILTAAENYGKQVSAFNQALAQAATARQQALYDIGADFITQSGQTITPNEAGKALGGSGFEEGTRMTAGFGTRGLSLIEQEGVGATYAQDVAAQERGITAGSGIRGTSRLVNQELGQEARQAAVQEFQSQAAAATAAVEQAGAERDQAKAEWDTVRGIKTKPTKRGESKTQAAKRRASARAAANQKAKAAGKPLPYGPGGAPKAKPTPGVKPPSPPKKKGNK